MGDSAGGNLVAQLLSHILHPVPSLGYDIVDIPIINPEIKLGGVFVLSPWANIIPDEMKTHNGGTWKTNHKYDIVTKSTLAYVGNRVLEAVRRRPAVLEVLYPYLTHAGMRKDWWDGLEQRVGRVLVSAGEFEVMRDDIVEFGRVLGRVHRDVEVMVVEGGVHDDPMFDFLYGDEVEKEARRELKRIVKWTRDVFCSL
ncbi:hypothetical protein CVT24_004544 [Panaeolus cyanescens]|uniref:Alpha/beta hydrolase fold-3 domain-containing protein n=1 Tax=Panaeolus cyanescens TaxID=181874 RepID=A0A409W1F4_9AGAR|nr:hypothetical protein CVT24_004544 [Panaeolus cyanescens]